MQLIVRGARCPTCKDILISCYDHDMHGCSCGSSFIDSGCISPRRGGKILPERVLITLELPSGITDISNSTRLFGVLKEDSEFISKIEKDD